MTDPSPLAGAAFIAAPASRSAVVRLSSSTRLERPASDVVKATFTATALGAYQASIHGAPVSDAVLSPGWSSYEWRVRYQQDDVTHLLSGDEVIVDILLAGGWYRGALGFSRAAVDYGDRTAAAAVLHLYYRDGSEQRIITDTSWEGWTTDSPAASLYDGQRIDARLRDRPERLDVIDVDVNRGVLAPQIAPPVTRHESVRPQRIWVSPSGRTLVDFGQNLVGWVRARAQGAKGTEITIRHAEVLERDELGVRPLRHAAATDVFVLSSGADEFEPTFTFHGFRYIDVAGWPGELTPDDIEAVVVHSAMTPTASFESSDPLVDRLVINAAWSQRGNFLSLPTDCPQRDERLGWTGDIAVFAPTAAFSFDVADFLHDWLLDLRAETEHASVVPYIVPDLMKSSDLEVFPATPTAIWGDAAVWVPEALWRAYGDLDRLAAHYPGMVMHLRSVEHALSPTGLWDAGFQFGDWLDPDAPPEHADAAKADKGVVATASLFRSASFAAEAATLLRDGQSARWHGLAARTRAAFNEHYVSGGRIRSDCATVYALAIHFNLLDDADRAAAGERLAQIVREGDHRVTTGFAGTPYVTWALSETGHIGEAYGLLLEKQCPSWLYPVTMGATTIWERWDSMLPDGAINPGEMTSFNHYALGGVVDWIHQVVGGIRAAAPGYRRVLIKPQPGPGIDFARLSFDSPVGQISTHWRIDEGTFRLETAIPPGIPAVVELPDGSRHHVVGGAHVFEAGVRF